MRMVRLSRHAPGVTQLSVFLPARAGGAERQAMVTIDSTPAMLSIGCWARSKGEPAYHCWPGPHIEEEFFSPIEQAILVAGTTEVAACCMGQVLDEDLGLRILETLALVMSWLANGYSEPAATPAAV